MMKNWIKVFRLRTIPLSISGVMMGSTIAFQKGIFNFNIFISALFTTITLQILSNIANDYGDGIKGTDNDERIGPIRGIQSGEISKKSMLYAIIISSLISLVLGIILLNNAFETISLNFIIFFIIGIIAISAAIKYTVGKSAFGYIGLGDLFVFVFFGLVAVIGSYYLYAKADLISVLLPAISIGMLSVAVLNLNNLRDIENDKNSKKFTIVTRVGVEKGKVYHSFLIMGAILCWAYFLMSQKDSKVLISMLAFVPLILHLKKSLKISESKDFDPELKIVSLSTLLLVLLYGAGTLMDVYFI